MFEELARINERPEPFQFYTASDLWTDEHASKQMLSFHLNEAIDVSSRNAEFINRSVEWIASEFNIGRDSKIVDFGCGPGLYATRLAKRGASVTGIDFSERSIEYAKENAAREQLNISYVNQNYLEFETEDRFDLVLMIMCDFCALSPTQRGGILSKFHKILRPSGSVLLDVYSLSASEQREEAAVYEVNQFNGFWSSNKYYGFLNTFKYHKEKVVLDKYTIIEPEKERIIRLTEGHDLVAPEVLPFEIGNALTAMMKKNTLKKEEVASAWDIVQQIPVDLRQTDIKSALKIATQFNIYAYDAYFLECANILRSPLFTLDLGMKRVAHEIGIIILE